MQCGWQYSYERRLNGHSWQDAAKHSVSAMITTLLLSILLLVVVAAVVAAVRLVAVDGYRRQPTCPRSLRHP